MEAEIVFFSVINLKLSILVLYRTVLHKNNQIFAFYLMKTLFVGQNSINVKVIDSTNSYASELLRNTKPPEGTVIYSFEQQNGRGQRGNKWESEPNKNGAFSFIFYPSFLQAEQQFILNKITSLAVADVMAELLKGSDKMQEIKIKWPNDVYIGTQKIAGILIENTLREKNIQHSIIGIGINVNQKTFGDNLNATSLTLLTGKEFELVYVLKRLCAFIEARYLQLKSNKSEYLNVAYLQRLYKLKEWHSYKSADQVFEGKIIGISAIGKLQVELRMGQLQEFDLKEIQFL